MILKVGVLGISGKMGQEVAALLSHGFSFLGDTLELSEAVGRTKKQLSFFNISVKALEVGPLNPSHVWIDFSHPEATLKLIEKTQEPMVVCTTGFDSTQTEMLMEESKKRALLLAPNTSPGIYLITSMLESLPQVSESGFEVFLEEAHHSRKKDRPSGTARSLEGTLEKKGNKPLEIYSIRAGGEKGRHRVSFIGEEEEFMVEHRVFDRSVFAKGALIAAHFLVNQKVGFYTMNDVWRKIHG